MNSRPKKRPALLASLVLAAALAAAAPARANDPIARPFEPITAKTQDKLLKSFRSLWKVLRDVPLDLYRCSGLLSDDGWTGVAIRNNSRLPGMLDRIFEYRLKKHADHEAVCFLNGDTGGTIQANHGLCAGVTTMNWVANYLSLYDVDGHTFRAFHPEMKLPKGYTRETFGALVRRTEAEWKAYLEAQGGWAESKLVLTDDERRILEFYAPFIDRLFRERRPTVIPYFADMNSFSEHPAIKTYLQKMAVETWYDVNVSLSSIVEILAFGQTPGIHRLEVNRLARQVRAYLDEKVQPIVFIYLPGEDKKRIHVLRVVASEWADDGDKLVISVVDPNYPPGHNVHAISFTGVTKNPKEIMAVYEPYRGMQTDPKTKELRSLTEVEIAPFFDHLSMRALMAWKRFLARDGEDALSRLAATAEAKSRKGKPPRELPAPPTPKAILPPPAGQ